MILCQQNHPQVHVGGVALRLVGSTLSGSTSTAAACRVPGLTGMLSSCRHFAQSCSMCKSCSGGKGLLVCKRGNSWLPCIGHGTTEWDANERRAAFSLPQRASTAHRRKRVRFQTGLLSANYNEPT